MNKNLLLFFMNSLIIFILPLHLHGEAWKFVIFGDTRSNDTMHRAVLQSIINNTPDYKFIINTGDVVESGSNIGQWQIWQAACNDVLGGTGQANIPPKYMAAAGNHDSVNSSGGLANWTAFLYGQAMQYGNDGKYFYFDYKNARFIILNSNSSLTGSQYTTLMQAAQNNPKEWLFAIWHHPIFDFGPKSYEDSIHDTWGIPLYQNRCDIIFMGHAHYYIRTSKLNLNGEKNPPLDPQQGTVQIVSGNGGAGLYSVDPNHDGNGYMLEAYTDSDHGYCELEVDGNILYLRHILWDGTVFDTETYIHSSVTDSPPSVSITNPANNTEVSGTVLIQANASDDHGISKVQFYINRTLVEDDTASPYQYSWDTTAYSNGNNEIIAVAWDTKNQATDQAINVTVNNSVSDNPPSVSITNPINNQTVSGTVLIQASASDDHGVSKVQFYINRSLVGEDTSLPYQYSWDTTAYSNGKNEIIAVAWDTKNQATDQAINVTVNNTGSDNPPSVSITNPINNQTVSGTVLIQASASDDHGVNKVAFFINGIKVGEDTTSPYQYAWDTLGNPNSSYTIIAAAFDNINQVEDDQVTVIVSN